MPTTQIHAAEAVGRRIRAAQPVLGCSMLVMGACGLAYEYTLGVLGNNLLGSSHEQIFVVIGLMLFAMGVGAAVQRRIVGDLVDRFLQIELLLGVLGGISAIVIYATFAYTESYQLVLYTFAFVIGVLIGCEIPLLIRINERYAADLRTNLSTTLALDYVGALIGALLFAYGLVVWFSVARIATILGLVNVGLAAVGLLTFRRLLRRPGLLAAAIAVALAGLGYATAHADRWTAELEQRCFADPIVHSSTSKYQHIVLTERADRLQLFLNGHLQWNSTDEAIYHEHLVHPAMVLARAPRSVLVLGGGDGLPVREVLRHATVEHVTVVDIDPAIVELARSVPAWIEVSGGALHDARVHLTFPPADDGASETAPVEMPSQLARRGLERDASYRLAEVEVFHVDADRFLDDLPRRRYDVAILDFPDPRSLEVAKLYSVDFYRNLRRHLAPDAWVAVQSTSPWHAAEVFRCIGATLRAAGYRTLPYHANVPSFGEWGWHLAWREDGPPPIEVAGRLDAITRFDRFTTRHLTPATMRAAFVFAKGWLEDPGGEEPPVHTKMRPVLVDLYRRAWR